MRKAKHQLFQNSSTSKYQSSHYYFTQNKTFSKPVKITNSFTSNFNYCIHNRACYDYNNMKTKAMTGNWADLQLTSIAEAVPVTVTVLWTHVAQDVGAHTYRNSGDRSWHRFCFFFPPRNGCSLFKLSPPWTHTIKAKTNVPPFAHTTSCSHKILEYDYFIISLKHAISPENK